MFLKTLKRIDVLKNKAYSSETRNNLRLPISLDNWAAVRKEKIKKEILLYTARGEFRG